MSNDPDTQSVLKCYCLITLTAQMRETSLTVEALQIYRKSQLHLQLQNREQSDWRLEELEINCARIEEKVPAKVFEHLHFHQYT